MTPWSYESDKIKIHKILMSDCLRCETMSLPNLLRLVIALIAVLDGVGKSYQFRIQSSFKLFRILPGRT